MTFGNCPPLDLPKIPFPTPPVDLRDYEEMEGEINSLAKNYPDLVRLEVLGQSAEGRDIYLVGLGNGDKRFMVTCRVHGAEVASTEALLDYLPILAEDRSHGANKIKEKCTLLVIPMVSPDMADLYAKTRHLLPNLPDELVELWYERSNKHPLYKHFIWALQYTNMIYANRNAERFDMVTSYKDKATGLTKFVSHMEDWIWLDDIDIQGDHGSNRDHWQLTLPESRAVYNALIKYKPQYFADLHGYVRNPAQSRLWRLSRGIEGGLGTKSTPDGKAIKYGFWARPALDPQAYAWDPDAAWKGIPLGQRFSDPRWLRFSMLPPSKKYMKGYQHPTTTRWELEEGLKITKIANAAVEEELDIGSVPIGWSTWNGQLAIPMTASQAAVVNPEFECASTITEAFGGHTTGSIGVDWGAKTQETTITSILRYLAGLDLPKSWSKFPIFQGPFDIWSKREFAERRVREDPDYFKTHFPDDVEKYL